VSTIALPAPPAARRPAVNATLWVLQLLLASLFAFAGVNKLFGLQQEMLDSFARMGFGDWFRHLTGVVELVGAVGLVVPRLAGYAAVWLIGLMVGAIVIHLTVLPPVALVIPPAVLAGLFAVIARHRLPRAGR
jgi:uncharacterized membrane protein YphA (DoxX/SURF4 family)